MRSLVKLDTRQCDCPVATVIMAGTKCMPILNNVSSSCSIIPVMENVHLLNASDLAWHSILATLLGGISTVLLFAILYALP